MSKESGKNSPEIYFVEDFKICHHLGSEIFHFFFDVGGPGTNAIILARQPVFPKPVLSADRAAQALKQTVQHLVSLGYEVWIDNERVS